MSLSRNGAEKRQLDVNERNESHHTLIAPTHGPSPKPRAHNIPTLRYRHRALVLLAFYVPLLIIPWSLTCVLNYHPVDGPSYFDQYGFAEDRLKLHRRFIDALAVLNSIASVVTIPIVSALLAQAAVVYTQRRRKSQNVSVRQAFALADRGWSNLSILYESWPPWKSHLPGPERGTAWQGSGSQFLWISAAFILLCGIQQPIREAIVSTEQTLVMTTQNNPVAGSYQYFRGDGSSPYIYIGADPEPDDLPSIPESVVVQDLANSLASTSVYETPVYLWPDLESRNPYRVLGDGDFTPRRGPWPGINQPAGFFVAAFRNGTTTGVLRHRAMRLNSTVECEEQDQSSFPSSCEGEGPFTASFSPSQRLQVRVCVPGQQGTYPWQLSRSRQDITEEIFISVNETGSENDGSDTSSSYTRHCIVETTRGYFELGNYRNKNEYGPLIDKWIQPEPEPFAEKGEFNDHLPDIWRDENTHTSTGNVTVNISGGRWKRPSEVDRKSDIPGWPIPPIFETRWPVAPGSTNNLTMSGPLMTSAVTMFGDSSLFALANASANESATLALAEICRNGRMPFSAFSNHRQYSEECGGAATTGDDDERIVQIMAKFMNGTFAETVDGMNYLSASVFFANQAMLLQTARKTETYTARPLYTAPGQFIPKPTVSLAGLVIISILVLLQLIGLAYLAWYIYQVPTWTAMLDALAIARITNSLDKGDIPAIGSLADSDLQRLRSINALVGVVETHAEGCTSDASPTSEGKTVELGLGASGLFSRRLAKFRVERSREVEMECHCEGCRRRRTDVESGSLTSFM